MAVVPRKHKKWTTYYAVNDWHGKQIAEKVGRNERAAEIRDRAMKKEIENDTYVPPASRVRDTVGDFGARWLSGRDNAYANDERRLFRLHIVSRPWLHDMHLDDVKPAKHIDRLVDELRREKKEDGSRRLTDKSIANLLGVLSLIFDAAVRDERCAANPVTLKPKELRRKAKVEKEIYSVAETLILVSHHSIPWPLRVLNAMCLLGGYREGEACGRHWRDLDDEPTPLASMYVHDQYNCKPLKKAEQPRMVPVHPELAMILEEWATEGFELYTGRRPTADDFIVPNIGSRSESPCWTRSMHYKAFVKHAEAAGIRPRSVHSTRHTFISLCRRGRCEKDDLEKITHNAAGDMVDRYTHKDWEPLCEAVLCLKLDVLPPMHSPPRFPGNSGGKGPSFLRENAGKSLVSTDKDPGSIPGASTTIQHKTSLALGPRKFPLQEFKGIAGNSEGQANRLRKRTLLSLAEADPVAAAPGLALCRALDAAIEGDPVAVEKALTVAATALQRGGK